MENYTTITYIYGLYDIKNPDIIRYIGKSNSIIEQITIPNAVKKSVIEIDNNGNEINKWKSLMDCSRETGIDNGNLSKVCNGKLPAIRGRKFIFN